MNSHDNGPRRIGIKIHPKAAAVCLRRSGGTFSGANLILKRDGLRFRSLTILQERENFLKKLKRGD